MDINHRIAARREEIARLEREAASERAAEQARARDAETRQREAAAEDLVAEINAGNAAEATRQGDVVELVHVPDDSFVDPALRKGVRQSLFEREVRKLWTPFDQWVIISLISGGICLIHLAGLGVVLIVAGIYRANVVNKRCRRRLREDYPDLFEAIPER